MKKLLRKVMVLATVVCLSILPASSVFAMDYSPDNNSENSVLRSSGFNRNGEGSGYTSLSFTLTESRNYTVLFGGKELYSNSSIWCTLVRDSDKQQMLYLQSNPDGSAVLKHNVPLSAGSYTVTINGANNYWYNVHIY